jgi:alkanesulfonate monooxygenase SsuD/methylene tetrahydromethanopterin reductase-like flavin-dependent oxidoreductase (luciferase family)
MRVGVILPTFAPTAAEALDAADEAEESGLDGVFAYDHLWPMGEPGRPAISPYPLLGAIAVRTRLVALGTLVARVGLAADEVLVEEMLSLEALSGGRLVAAVGTGDAKSAQENRAYGIAVRPAHERRAQLAAVLTALVSAGVTAWGGGGSLATNAAIRASGAALNLWAAPVEAVADAARDGEVTWAGRLPSHREPAAALLAALEAAGASWACVIWPGAAAPVVAAASTARRCGG